jgi:hypothetical protein
MSKKKILLLSANPANTDRLRVEAEFREIEECCQKSSLRDRFAIVTKAAVRMAFYNLASGATSLEQIIQSAA